MAQEKSRGLRKVKLLARRYGLTGGRLVAVACSVLVALVLVGSLAWKALQGDGFQIVRPGGSQELGQAASDEATDGAEDQGAESEGGAEAARGGEGTGDGDPSEEATEDPAPATLVVHVDGAVVAPGVYALPPGARANDAVSAAGGLAEDADTSSINLAVPLVDGDKVHVPRAGESVAATGGGPAGTGTSAGSSSGGASGVAGTGASGASKGTSGLVNINTATTADLQTLPGVGEATAAAIVQEREKNGPFASKEDLMRVSGIGEKKYAKLEALICV